LRDIAGRTGGARGASRRRSRPGAGLPGRRRGRRRPAGREPARCTWRCRGGRGGPRRPGPAGARSLPACARRTCGTRSRGRSRRPRSTGTGGGRRRQGRNSRGGRTKTGRRSRNRRPRRVISQSGYQSVASGVLAANRRTAAACSSCGRPFRRIWVPLLWWQTSRPQKTRQPGRSASQHGPTGPSRPDGGPRQRRSASGVRPPAQARDTPEPSEPRTSRVGPGRPPGGLSGANGPRQLRMTGCDGRPWQASLWRQRFWRQRQRP
jgi:hypothetical protein